MSKLYQSLAAFQQEVPPIFKGASGYGYKYADWNEILAIVNPLLEKHSLGFSQPLDGTSVKTIVFHTETGETIEGSVDIPQGVQLKGMNDFQVLGSAITYLRRYSLSSILGLVTDEDADAAGEQKRPKNAEKPQEATPKWEPSKVKPATDNQKIYIANLLRQHGIYKESMAEYLADKYGINGDMSQADAQLIIDDHDTRGATNGKDKAAA